MLLTTSYGLNNSHTKTIHVGLQRTNKGIFKPLVKLTGHNADGIYFDTECWQLFQEQLGLMNEYLTSDNRVKPNFVIIKNYTINFTTSYGAKSILLACKEEEENSKENLPKEEDALDSTPPAKKRRTYTAAIVMQKTTFLGLQSIVKCIDARLKQLESLSDNVNKCALYLIQEIELKLPVSFINQEIIKLTLRGNYEDIERNVRTQINDLTFLDMYFNIIFLELTSLRYNEIIHIILTKRESFD
ncbi:hypothetical protein ALC60_09497 [Trachymyrmex zeteki]|uniref:Uncharacterized protein n=1 Tax=Mycetomoellerius zeteki TaxID=64791 RepID=A0A151WQA5_9HYME|nr:hypothetical protein ALC60_10835 [Trachymyrmex zeteki]KYQ51402.1 hypothetical protein ALC60_09497 [Trachymyrmex zeteki]